MYLLHTVSSKVEVLFTFIFKVSADVPVDVPVDLWKMWVISQPWKMHWKATESTKEFKYQIDGYTARGGSNNVHVYIE